MKTIERMDTKRWDKVFSKLTKIGFDIEAFDEIIYKGWMKIVVVPEGFALYTTKPEKQEYAKVATFHNDNYLMKSVKILIKANRKENV